MKTPAKYNGTFLIVAGTAVLLGASVLTYVYGNSSWFTLLILYTGYLALRLRPVPSLIIAAGGASYASFFNLYLRGADFNIEFFFVILVWLATGYVPSKLRELYLHYKGKEEFLRSILQATPHGVVQTDLEGYISFCNTELLSIVGAETEAQVCGKNVLEFILPEKRENAREVMKRTLAEGCCKHLEYSGYRIDGSVSEHDLSIALTYRTGGHQRTPTGFVGIVRDITEEKKHLWDAQRFRRLLDEVNDAILIHSVQEGKIVDVNEAALTMGGYSREELLEKSVLELDVGKTTQEQEGIKEEVLEKGGTTFETINVLKDGSKAHTEVKLSKIEIQHEPYLVSVVRDITRARRAEIQNRERALYLEALLNSSPSAMITLDPENKIREWNPGAQRLFHYSREEALGRNIDALITGNDEAVQLAAHELTDSVSRGRHLPPTDVLRYTREGSPIEAIVTAAPIMTGGSINGVVAVYTDNTSFKEAQRRVNALLHEKEQLLKEVHHRIKNHMHTISSIISLHSSHCGDENTAELLDEIISKIRVMQTIYQNLYIGEDVNAVSLHSFVEPLLRDLETAYVYMGSIEIRHEIEELTISARQSLSVGIVVNELVTNSLKYSFPEGGRGTISVSVSSVGEQVLRIAVADDGSGIPDTVMKNEDYGFGLTLVDGYARQYNGSMEINNENGTTVTVTIELEPLE